MKTVRAKYLLALLWRALSVCHKAWLAWKVRGAQTPELSMIVVGALRIGGGGRTPVTAALAMEKANKGLRTCILCYAVHSTSQQVLVEVAPDSDWRASSDEAVWLARTTGVPVFATRNRWAAWKILEKRNLFDLVISDDGLEDPRLHKARQILLDWGDANHSWKNIYPAGVCRSLLQDHPHCLQIEIDATKLRISTIINCAGILLQDEVWLICALGDPQRLRLDLQAWGARLAGITSLRDHAQTLSKQVGKILSTQRCAVVLTEKDWIKLSASMQQNPRIFVTRQTIDAKWLQALLAAV